MNRLLTRKVIGQIAIAYAGSDPTAPAKIIKKFSNDNDCLEVVGLYFDGTLYDPSKYKELANLPSYEELLTKLVYGTISVFLFLYRRMYGAMLLLRLHSKVIPFLILQ